VRGLAVDRPEQADKVVFRETRLVSDVVEIDRRMVVPVDKELGPDDPAIEILSGIFVQDHNDNSPAGLSGPAASSSIFPGDYPAAVPAFFFIKPRTMPITPPPIAPITVEPTISAICGM